MKLSLKHIIIVIVVLMLAVAFFFNKQILLSLDGSSSTPENNSTENPIPPSTESPPKKKHKKTTSGNSAADGLSKFYEKIYGSGKKGGVEIINNIVYLPDPKGDVEELLKARSLVVRPYKKYWVGTKTSRPFRKGETIYEKLSQYALEEKLEVIWWTNKDFIIKDNFRINKDIIYTTFQLINAVSGHFENGLKAYFCYNERSLVVTDNPFKYLSENCTLLESNKDQS